jgi:DNA ligase 4
MPFPYKFICDLLQQVYDETCKPAGKRTCEELIITSWFQKHRALIDTPSTDPSTIISTLLPERRTDRVYNIQAPRLQSIFGKALLLGASRVSELRRWTEPGSGVDLADCVECILSRTVSLLVTHSVRSQSCSAT